jgi:hypothetical protein
LKKPNLCFLSNKAKTLLTKEVIPKNKEVVITLRLCKSYTAEKTLAIRAKIYQERTTARSIHTSKIMKDLKNNVIIVAKL